MGAVSRLCAAVLAGAASAAAAADGAAWPDEMVLESCVLARNVSTDDCVAVEALVPSVIAAAAGEGFEFGWPARLKEDAEVELGNKLRASSKVLRASHEFIDRVLQVITEGSRIVGLNLTEDQAVIRAMGWAGKTREQVQSYSGYVEENDIPEAASRGNIRERWALVYVMNRNKFFNTILQQLSSLPSTFVHKHLQFLNTEALQVRRELIHRTVKSHSGVANFVFPVVQSWARLAFNYSTPHAQWIGCRQERSMCGPLDKRVDDSFFFPPLSPRERRLQCGDSTSNCEVKWCAGRNKFHLVNTSFAPGLQDGYLQRTVASGYRAVAGPSATTANMMQLATLLGYKEEELPLLAVAMIAWMLPALDHSLFEIVLGAAPFVKPKQVADLTLKLLGLQPFVQQEES